MAVRKEISGKTYEIDLSVSAQSRVENIANKPFTGVMTRFLGGFTGDMHLILDNCVSIVEGDKIRPIRDDEKGVLAIDAEVATEFGLMFAEAMKEYQNFIGVKMELPQPSSDGVSQDIIQKPSGKSPRGKSK